jgi:outer membrane lipase/esterase
MKTLKRMIVALLALLPLATGMAFADTEDDYSRMFVFGASLLDSGNHFAVTGETAHPPFVPMGPSYGVGGHHFSNGPTWVEDLAKEMGLTQWAKPAYRDPAFGNYAYGYARAREVSHDPVEQNLYVQVQAWKNNGYCTYAEMNDTLFVVDSAYFDLLDIMAAMAPPEPNFEAAMLIMTEMALSIEYNINELYDCGARNLLFAYLPPVEYGPVANGGQHPNQIEPFLSKTYNDVLAWVLFYDSDPLPSDMNISTIDFMEALDGIVAMSDELGFTNVTDSCVTFGVMQKAFCKDRDGYLWWDPLHPTKKLHALLGKYALAQVHVPD